MHNFWNPGNSSNSSNFSVFSDNGSTPSYASMTMGTSNGNRAGPSSGRNQPPPPPAPPVIHKQYQLFDEHPNLDLAKELLKPVSFEKPMSFENEMVATNVNSSVIQPAAHNMMNIQANSMEGFHNGNEIVREDDDDVPSLPTILDVLMLCADIPVNGPVTFKPEYFSHFTKEQLSAIYRQAESILFSTLTPENLTEMVGSVIRRDIILENEDQFEFVLSKNKHLLITSFNPFAAIKMLPPLVNINGIRPLLPLKTIDSPDYTLILDLDETLVHCTTTQPDNSYYNYLIRFHGSPYMVFVNMRPYYRTFLERLSKVYEIILFTASKKSYANEIANLLDPNREYIRHRLFREHCISVNGNYVKNLNLLGRDLSKTVIVDNSPLAFGYHLDNGVPITSWFAEQSDRELLHLIPFLERLACVQGDVRAEIQERYDLRRYILSNGNHQ